MSIFKFKQFSIQQTQSAAKVGTDGVLLGAWISGSKFYHILDIGAGTGLISLMMAQRFYESQITALEIDEKAYQEALVNFKNSPWEDRLNIYHTSFQKFNPKNNFDLIISNPPFYREDTFASCSRRDLARNSKHLPFNILIEKSTSLLKPNGCLAVIIPHSEEGELIDLAEFHEIYPSKICRVRGNENSILKRSMITFSKKKSNYESQELIVEISRNVYTDEYKDLTKDFYLNM